MRVEKGTVRAPEIGRIWLNSPPLNFRQLRGRAVLVDFWDYTCVNCIRTLPYVQAWHERYHGFGLTVIGVHTPEFTFAQYESNVERGIREFVAGTGGKNHRPFTAPKANSEVRDATAFGVLELTLRPNAYDWQFIPEAGKTFTDSGSGTCH